jgi:hypothetical protein
VRQLLIALDLCYHGRPYYRTLVGLTDEQGVVELTGDALREEYREAQREFPMDYKLAIRDCDPEAIIILRGGPQFEGRRKRALQAPMIREPYQSWWAAAQNTAVAPAEARCTFDGAIVDIRVPVQRAGTT